MMDVKQLRNRLEQQKGQRTQIQKSIRDTRLRVRSLRQSLKDHEDAREVIRNVAIETQQQLSFHIEDITSLALEAIFPDPYQLIAEFVQRRNKTECDLYFVRNGNRVDPLSASGGGAVDVAAFALRVASWSMSHPKSRNTIVLDEPMRFLSRDHQEKASQMLKELSIRLGIQFLIITHNDMLTSFADKVFETKLRNGVTEIK